ncbi:MAG: SIP domain-containing protein, partial [Solirubrobacteraceae bacterium]
GYYWMAGETRTVRAARRHLRHERGIARRERYSLTGYWMVVGAERYLERYAEMSGELEAIWARSEVEGADVEEVMDEYEEALEDAGL